MLFSRLLFHVSKNKVMYNRCREWDINNITLLISRPIIKFNIPFYFSNYPSSFHRWLNSRRKIFSFQSFLTRLRSSSLDFYYFLTLFFFFFFVLFVFISPISSFLFQHLYYTFSFSFDIIDKKYPISSYYNKKRKLHDACTFRYLLYLYLFR